jgi:surface protein
MRLLYTRNNCVFVYTTLYTKQKDMSRKRAKTTGNVEEKKHTLRMQAIQEVLQATVLSTLVNEYAEPMVLRWLVRGTIHMPFVSHRDYNYRGTVDWGDGSRLECFHGPVLSHTYPTGMHEQIVTIKLTGNVPAFDCSHINPEFSNHTIVSVRWGDVGRLGHRHTTRGFFAYCKELIDLGVPPDIGLVTNTSYMFALARKFNGDLSAWDVGRVTDMSYMFSGTQLFNGDISTWSVLPTCHICSRKQ